MYCCDLTFRRNLLFKAVVGPSNAVFSRVAAEASHDSVLALMSARMADLKVLVFADEPLRHDGSNTMRQLQACWKRGCQLLKQWIDIKRFQKK